MMATMRPLDASGVLSVVFEAILYGTYVILFVISMRQIVARGRPATRPSKIFFWASLFMFFIATLHIILNVFRLVRCIVLSLDFYTNQWDITLKGSMNALVAWVAGGLVIYRCYIIWNHNIFIVIPPITFMFISIVITGVVIDEYREPHPAEWAPRLTFVVVCLIFIQNAMTTGLIAWNLWRHDQRMATATRNCPGASVPSSLRPIIRIIVESAAIYLFELFLVIIFVAIEHPAQFVAEEMLVPSAGIIFALITLRITTQTTRQPRVASPLTDVHFELGHSPTNTDGTVFARGDPREAPRHGADIQRPSGIYHAASSEGLDSKLFALRSGDGIGPRVLPLT